jgi:hypothetical protein
MPALFEAYRMAAMRPERVAGASCALLREAPPHSPLVTGLDAAQYGRLVELGHALQELIDLVRTIESRLTALEGKGRIHPTAEMGLPNRR